MNLDEDLSLDEKMRYLRATLQQTLEEREKETAPMSLRDADPKTWRALKVGIRTVERFLGGGHEGVGEGR